MSRRKLALEGESRCHATRGNANHGLTAFGFLRSDFDQIGGRIATRVNPTAVFLLNESVIVKTYQAVAQYRGRADSGHGNAASVGRSAHDGNKLASSNTGSVALTGGA